MEAGRLSVRLMSPHKWGVEGTFGETVKDYSVLSFSLRHVPGDIKIKNDTSLISVRH